MEPVQTSIYNDWKDTDSFYVCDEAISRGTETSFKLNFQNCSAPNFNAVKAGLDKNALSLVVTALNEVRVFRILQSGYKGDGPYKFSSPAAELTGARGLVRDVSWAPTPWKLHDQIATASADGYVRIYDIWTPKQSSDSHPQQLSTTSERNNTFARGYNNRPQSGIGAGLAGVAESELGHSEAGQIIHDWKLVAELKHEGVWKVEWLQNGGALVSAGDTGKAHLWRHAVDGSWKEFADFGPGEVGT